MSQSTSLSGVLDYHDQSLLPLYEGVCGDADSYPEAKAEFARTMDGGPLAMMAHLTNLNAASAGTSVGYFFLQFLDDGKNCHTTSFLAQAQNQAQAIQGAADPLMRYQLWRTFMNGFLDAVEGLALYLSEIPSSGFIKNPLRRNITLAARQVEILAQHIENILSKHMWAEESRPASQEEEVITAQMETLYPFRYYAANATGNLHTPAKPQIRIVDHRRKRWRRGREQKTDIGNGQVVTDPRINRWLLQKAWAELTNPFRWLYDTYVSNLKQLGVKVGINDFPDIEPLNPALVREIIDEIILIAAKLGTPQEPLPLNFSWDEKGKLLLIHTPHPMNLLRDSSWERVENLVEGLKGEFGLQYEDDDSPPSIYIHIPLLNLPDSQSSPGGAGNIPPPAFGGSEPLGLTGSGAQGRALISGFYVPPDPFVAGTYTQEVEYLSCPPSINNSVYNVVFTQGLATYSMGPQTTSYLPVPAPHIMYSSPFLTGV